MVRTLEMKGNFELDMYQKGTVLSNLNIGDINMEFLDRSKLL